MTESIQPYPSPSNQPPPNGVYGSLERVIATSAVGGMLPKVDDPNLGPYPNVWLFERPEQAPVYPCVVIRSGRASLVDETFEGHKYKEYPAVIETFATTEDEAAKIARAIERALEDPAVPARIAAWVGALRDEDDCGVSVQDEGEDWDREHKRYSPAGLRPVVCRWSWRIGVKYLSSPARGA